MHTWLERGVAAHNWLIGRALALHFLQGCLARPWGAPSRTYVNTRSVHIWKNKHGGHCVRQMLTPGNPKSVPKAHRQIAMQHTAVPPWRRAWFADPLPMDDMQSHKDETPLWSRVEASLFQTKNWTPRAQMVSVQCNWTLVGGGGEYCALGWSVHCEIDVAPPESAVLYLPAQSLLWRRR